MRNKISILIMIFLVFVLVCSTFVSAADLRYWQHWFGIDNEKSITTAEAETMYINNNGDLVYTKKGVQKTYPQWRVEDDSNLVQIHTGTWGGWQYFEYSDGKADGDNIDYASFVRVVNQNKNKYANSMYKDSVSGYSTPVTVDDNLKSDGNAKSFGPKKKERDAQLKKTTEAKARAGTATTGAGTASASAVNKGNSYNYDGAIGDLDTAITELEAAEQQAKDAGLASEAAKLAKQRAKVEALRETYVDRKTAETALGAVVEIEERNALAADIARLDQDIAKARAAKNNAEIRRLTKEKRELEKIRNQEVDIIDLLVQANAIDVTPERKAALEKQIKSKRTELAADQAYQKQIDDTRDEIIAAAKDPRMNEKWQDLKKRGKDKNLAALKNLLAQHELEQRAEKDYGIDLEGRTHNQVKSELAKREKIKKDAQAAGLTSDEYNDIVKEARANPDWDSRDFEKATYGKVAEKYGVDPADKTGSKIKSEVKKRKKVIDKAVAAMVKNGADPIEARKDLMAKAKEIEDPKEFAAAAKDLEEREKVRQEIKKFLAAIDTLDIGEGYKEDIKVDFEAALEKGTGAEARAEFDKWRVAILKELEPSNAELVSKAYAGVAPEPEAKAKPADMGYYDSIDAKIDEELKKPLPDYAQINAWKKEKEEFDGNYMEYQANYIGLNGNRDGIKDYKDFKSAGELDQENKIFDARYTAKEMGLPVDQTKDKTLPEVKQMMATKSKGILQSKVNGIDPNTNQATLTLTDSEVVALKYQAAAGDDQAASQALALLIAGGETEAVEELLSENLELAQKNLELVEYIDNLENAGAQGIYDDEKANFLKAIRTGKHRQVAEQINTLVLKGGTNIFTNIGKKGTRYEGWTKVDSWESGGKTTALVKDPSTGNYYVITDGSTQRNEDMYRVPKGKFKDDDGKQQEYASPYVYYNALREGTIVAPTPDEATRQNQVSDLQLILDGNELYNGKIEENKEIGYVAEIGKEDSDIAVFMKPNKHDGNILKKELEPFGTGFGRFSIGDEMYVNKDGAVYNKEEEAIESSLLYADGNIALANYNIDLGSNVRVFSSIEGKDAEGKVQYNYWACYEVRGQQRCEKTDLTTFVAPEFAGDKKNKDLEDKIKTRQRFQRFLGTLIRGPTGVGKYYSDKINDDWESANPKWKAEIDRWMENEWFQPEEWERLICRAALDEDIPDDVQIGFDVAGNVDVSKRLQVERETMPDNSTLYQFNWMVRASNTNIMYTICADTAYCDANCLVIEGATDIAVLKGSSSSNYVPVYGPSNVDWASLCYREEILDDDGEPSGEFGPLMAFAQPIVEENYVPGDAAEHSGYHAGGSSATTVPTGAGTFGNQTG